MVNLESAIDLHVGDRIRARRIEIGMTQTELATEIDVSYQQVQKYESGRSRVAASRLALIAKRLQIAPSYFFDHLDVVRRPAHVEVDAEWSALDAESMYLGSLYRRIGNADVRRDLLALVRSLAMSTHHGAKQEVSGYGGHPCNDPDGSAPEQDGRHLPEK